MWRRKSHYRPPKKPFSKPENTPIATAGPKRELSEIFGFCASMPPFATMAKNIQRFHQKTGDKKIALDRKVLSEMAMKYPEQFKKFVESVK